MSKKKTDSCYVTESGTVRLRNKKGLSSNAGLSNIVQFYPTPRASDRNSPGIHGNGGQDLRTVVAMMEGLYPTPTAQDAKNLTLGITGKLNPEWVEWLMGYPIGWTELKDLGIP
jgi:hypothetical protein